MNDDSPSRLQAIVGNLAIAAFWIGAVYALVVYGPRLWRDAPDRASEYRLRFVEARILLTVVNVRQAKNALFLQDFQLTDGMKDDDRVRIINGSSNGCKGLYGNDETRCLTLIQLSAERKALDVLEQRLWLIVTSAQPDEATLPSGAQKYTPPLWTLLRHTVVPGKENIKEALPMIRAIREIQKPPGTKVSRRILVGGCGPESAPTCREGMLTEARKKGLIVVDEVEATR